MKRLVAIIKRCGYGRKYFKILINQGRKYPEQENQQERENESQKVKHIEAKTHKYKTLLP
jgi:hypothetical protein